MPAGGNAIIVDGEIDVAPQMKLQTATVGSIFVGPISGIIEVTCSHPLDRIKTKMQEMSLSHRIPRVQCAIQCIYGSAGMKGFYSGYNARILGIMPMRFVYWETMRLMNKQVEDKPRWFQLLVPGIAVGMAQTMIDNPIEVLKVRRMTGETKTALGEIFKGFEPCLVRNIVFSITVSASVKTFGEDQPFLAGAMGGLIGSAISQPFDVAKTEMQRYNGNQTAKGMWSIFKRVGQKNPAGLFSGGLMRSAMGFVNMGVGFVAFKYIYNLVSQY
jgi:hypothetical protein